MYMTFMVESPKCAELCASLYTNASIVMEGSSIKWFGQRYLSLSTNVGVLFSIFSTFFPHLDRIVVFITFNLLKKYF